MSGGWKLEDGARAALLARFAPRYARAVAHHVTYPGLTDTDPLPAPARVRIVGHADDGAGVEAMVVTVDGGRARPDGGTWHITWSLAEGRRAVESNAVIASGGFVGLDGPEVATRPGRW